MSKWFDLSSLQRLPLWPRSLFGRLLAALLLSLLLTLIIATLLILRDRRELTLRVVGGPDWATRIAEIAKQVERLEPEERAAALAELMRTPVPTGEPLPPPRLRNHLPLDEAQRVLGARVRKNLGEGFEVAVTAPEATDQRVIRFVQVPPMDGRPGPRTVDVAVRFPDGQRLVFRTPAPLREPGPPLRLFRELGILVLILLIVLYAVTRSITRPLSDLALATEAVGRRIHHPPLPEKGASEVRAATRAFNTMQDRLRRYLDSRTRVFAAMSHDLKTPLTRLRLRVEALDNPELQARFNKDLDEMESMVQGTLSLLKGLGDDEPFESTNINALLATLSAEFREMSAQITVTGSAQAPIQAQPNALKRCLTNLIDNAIKFGNRADIVVEDGADLVIRVRDSGPGVPEEEIERVFEPFYRLESSRSRDTGGTGLGLSIARDVAQAHSGSVTLTNLPQGGLEAKLILPRHRPGNTRTSH